MNALRSAILMAAALSMQAIGGVSQKLAPSRTKQFSAPGPRLGRSRSKKYPEQSSRQANRGARRAQGGPGLVQTSAGSWIPRVGGAD